MKYAIRALSLPVVFLLVAGLISTLESPAAPKKIADSSEPEFYYYDHTDHVAASDSSTVGQFEINYRDHQERPARWDPCRPITWRYNSKKQKVKKSKKAVKSILRALARETGLRFSYLGKTKAAVAKGLPTSSDLVVGWARNRNKLFRRPGKKTAAAITTTRRGWFSIGGQETAPEIYLARIALNRKHIKKRRVLKQALLHELGHLAGLGHVKSHQEQMFPTLNPLISLSYGPGDRSGLRQLGSSNGCIEPSRRNWPKVNEQETPASPPSEHQVLMPR